MKKLGKKHTKTNMNEGPGVPCKGFKSEEH